MSQASYSRRLTCSRYIPPRLPSPAQTPGGLASAMSRAGAGAGQQRQFADIGVRRGRQRPRDHGGQRGRLLPCRVGEGTSGVRVAACAASVPGYGEHDAGWGSQLRYAGCDVLGQLVVVKACPAYFPEAGIVLCLACVHLVCGRRPGRAIPGPLSRRCCRDAAGAAAWRGRSFRRRGAPLDSARPPTRRARGRARWPSRRPRRSPARPAGT